jgi:hypothetical protein
MKKKQKGYLVATFEGFPGVRIPLLTDQECKERGIEPGRFGRLRSRKRGASWLRCLVRWQ